MASFCAMYQNLGEFIKAKGPRKKSLDSRINMHENLFFPLSFPHLRNNRKSNRGADS